MASDDDWCEATEGYEIAAKEAEDRIAALEQELRRARLAIKAAMREPPYLGLLEQALAGINTVLPEHEPEPGPPRMD